jgi:CHAT domain-containing protein/Tfp pilus assembly protein PilF
LYYHQALEIQEKLAPGGADTAGTLSNLGLLSADQGDLPRAEKYYRQALTISQKVSPNSPGLANILNGLGTVAQESGEFTTAEKYYRQALTMWKKVSPDSLEMVRSLNNLGMVARERGDLTNAGKFSRQALSHQEKLPPDCSVVLQILHSAGDIARDRGDLTKAEEYYRQALALLEKLAPASSGRAETLASLAEIMVRKQQFQAAAELFAQSLDVLENQNTHLGGGEEVRAGFRAKHATYYKDYIDLLVAQKQPELAFYVLERSRARTLLETLAQAHVDIHTGVDARLLEQERSLQSQISAKSERRLRLLESGQRQDQVALFDREIADLLGRYREVQGQIRAVSPGYAALTQPQPLTAKEVQEQLLDADTLLLEYALGEEHSYVFAVSPDSLMVSALPKRAEIERAARRVYRLLTAENGTARGETRLRRQTRLTKARTEFPKAAADLTRMVLGPVDAETKKRKRLLIVGDGALQYIPFAALPSPRGPSTSLAAEYEIVNLPSASALAVLRTEFAGRQVAAKAVAVLADPVFNPHDDRLRLPSPSTATQSVPPDSSQSEQRDRLNRSALQAGVARGGLFPRLPFTRREAETIASIASKGEAIAALDFDASKATAVSPDLRDYRILHFATHGLLNSEHPELSGLVFSLVDRQGHLQDGFLRLLDIYNLDLNADLVVLSACQTALGKQIEQEGLVGLTRGFMYAGAARVLASLWKVDDEATAELMKRFYEAILRERQTPAQALRTAQMWLRVQKKWRDPYYWAGFVLQGEWK